MNNRTSYDSIEVMTKQAEERDLEHCPKCHKRLPTDFLLAAAGAARARLRPPENRRGKAKILKPCPFCKKKFGVAEMRTHKPVCPKKV